jgi:hypothetical protein
MPITGSDDTLIQLGRLNNSLWTGPGDDAINPGIGNDMPSAGRALGMHRGLQRRR